MKVKNIMFSGFAAAILMGVAAEANAAPKVVASKGYVDAITGQITGLNGSASGAANLVSAINTKLGQVEAVTGGLAEGEYYSSVTQTVDGQVAVTKGELATSINNTDMKAPTTKAVYEAIQNVEGQTVGLDLDAVGGDLQYVKLVSQADGQVSAEAGVIDEQMDRESTNLVTNKAITTALAFKQDILDTDQMAAVNSGITSGKVTAYEAYATTKQDTLAGAQLQAVNSGITSDKVTAYDAYATTKQDKLTAGKFIAIDEQTGEITTTYSEGDNITINADGKISTTFPEMPEACTASGVTCVLTSENGGFAWAVLTQPYTYTSGDVTDEEAIANLGDAAQKQKITEQFYRQ